MKISRIKHVVITSIIFLIIIAVIVFVYNSMLNAIKSNTEEMVYRVIAKEDIEPGKEITANNVERVQVQNVLNADGMIYRLSEGDRHTEFVTDAQKGAQISKEDGRWAIGKIAKDKIYKGEVLLTDNLVLKQNVVADETRLYAIPFGSSTTGGYNISLGEKVDICILYDDDEGTISEYQKLDTNKVIDIVLAEKPIADIRDESGNSRTNADGAAVVPGYVCFNLTYEEINTIELAKRQGTLFIGSAANYYKDGSQSATFMTDAKMPTFKLEGEN